MLDLSKSYITKSGLEWAFYYVERYDIRADEEHCDDCLIGSVTLPDGSHRQVAHRLDGRFYSGSDRSMDLIEKLAYQDIPIGTRVLAYKGSSTTVRRRYFAGVSADGKPLCFQNGQDPWTTNGILHEFDRVALWEEV